MCVKILKPKTEINKSYREIKILTLDQLIELEHNKLAYKISKGTLPRKIKEIIHCDQNIDVNNSCILLVTQRDCAVHTYSVTAASTFMGKLQPFSYEARTEAC